MLDALPPPAIYEEAPDWVRTPSGLLIPQKKAVLPGLVPGAMPGLAGSGFGFSQMAPWDVPAANIGTINSAALGTANPSVSTSAAFAVAANSEILVWAFFRTNILNDPGTAVTTLTDNQGGTYSLVGTPQTVSYNNAGTLSTWRGGLFKRDARMASAAASMTVTMSTAWTGSNSSSFNGAYIFEIKNPYALTLKLQERLTTGQVFATPITLTNTGDVFCMDFFCGGGAVVAESAQSGFTSIAGSTAFTSNQMRLQVWTSALNAQNPARTMAINATLGGAASSFAVYFEVPRSASAISFSQTDFQNSPTFQNSFTSTFNIGAPAADRQVIVYVGGAANGTTSIAFTGCTAPGVTFIPVLQAGNAQNSASIYAALVPTGTTLAITLTGTGLPFHSVNIFRVVGAAKLGNNQIGATVAGAGEAAPGLAYFYGTTVNSPAALLTNRFVPKGAVALGGGGSRSAGTTIITSGTNPWTDFAISTSPYAKGCFKVNSSGADETNVTYQINYSGSIAMHLLMAAFGP